MDLRVLHVLLPEDILPDEPARLALVGPESHELQPIVSRLVAMHAPVFDVVPETK